MRTFDFQSGTKYSAVSPSDSVDVFPDHNPCLVKCTGAGGNISVIAANGQTLTLPIGANEWLLDGMLFVTRVRATGTTATGLVAIAE
jgi:hypothetical protein